MNAAGVISYCPNVDDQFVLIKNRSRFLYKIEEISQEDDSHHISKSGNTLRLSENSIARMMVATNDNFSEDVRCYDLYPKSAKGDQMIALGHPSGKVRITHFSNAKSSDLDTVDEAVFQQHETVNRSCNCLSWNPSYDQLLAAGFDKRTNNQAGNVWIKDVSRPDIKELIVNNTVLKKEIGIFNESVLDIKWLDESHLVIGSQSSVKIYDIRDGKKKLEKNTRANGIALNKYKSFYMATFSSIDHPAVNFWDIRFTRKTGDLVHKINESNQISQVSWCPTRNGFIGILYANLPIIKLYDLQFSDYEEIEHLDRTISIPNLNENLSSYSWHPSHRRRLITITDRGLVKDMHVYERMLVTCSNDLNLSWTNDDKVIKRDLSDLAICNFTDQDIGDIAIEIKRRAKLGYGCHDDLLKNSDIVIDSNLKTSWQNLTRMKKHLKIENNIGFVGVYALFANFDIDFDKSSSLTLDWIPKMDDNQIRDSNLDPIRIYHNKERANILEMCGLCSVNQRETEEFEKKLNTIAEDNVERAATLAVIYKRLDLAIKILMNCPSEELKLLAIAISGFNENNLNTWKNTCSRLYPILKSTYLSSLFHFLNSSQQNIPDYDYILYSKKLDVNDKITFSCIHLSDRNLLNYLEVLLKGYVCKGDLNGLLLTGFSNEGLNLIQNYLDNTGDIQTASLLSQFSSDNDQRKMIWLDEYRNLLDSWCFWHERADLDIYLKDLVKSSPQLFVNCNFCGKSISAAGSSSNPSNYIMFNKPNTNMNRINACPSPNCRKPLPRCCICLSHMGTSSRLVQTSGLTKHSKFSDWFTWCQKCRHGGHSDHLKNWFSETNYCPVNGCTCKCPCLDSFCHLNQTAMNI